MYPGVQGSEGNCEADDPEQTSRSGDRTECEYPPHTGVTRRNHPVTGSEFPALDVVRHISRIVGLCVYNKGIQQQVTTTTTQQQQQHN